MSVGVGALAAAISYTARYGIGASRNRIAITQAQWSAEGCVARARALIAERLRDAGLSAQAEPNAWNRASAILIPAFQADDCALDVRAVGALLDVNTIDATTLIAVLLERGIAPDDADSLATVLVAGRPFYDARAIAELLGPAFSLRVGEILGVEPGPISLNHAHAAILAVLPGFTSELVVRVTAVRKRESFRSFQQLARGLSPAAQDTLAASAAQLPAVAVLEPDGWVIEARRTAGAPAVTAVVELRVARSGWRVVGVRRRSWVQ